MLLRYADTDPFFNWHSKERLILALAALIAAWLHLFVFLLIGPLTVIPDFTPPDPSEHFIELDLELGSPPEPLAPPPAPVTPPDTVDLSAAPASPQIQTQTGNTPVDPDSLALENLRDLPLSDNSELIPDQKAEEINSPPKDTNTISVEESTQLLSKNYNTAVRSAVASRWILPPEARGNFRPGRFTASLTLDNLGQVLNIWVEESSGSPSLDYAAMEALRAAPYPPFPEELAASAESLNFKFHFDYRAMVRRPGTQE